MTAKGKKFLEEVSRNEALKERFIKIDRKEEGAFEKAAALAKEFGFDLEPQDLSVEAPQGQLSDDDLEGAAGGIWGDGVVVSPFTTGIKNGPVVDRPVCACASGGPIAQEDDNQNQIDVNTKVVNVDVDQW